MIPSNLRFSLPSYAKINLGLHITGKRLDGYHELATVFQQVGLCDYLHFEFSKSGNTTIDLAVSGNPELHSDKENLVYRAASLFLAKIETNISVSITLEKKIPIGAGLGGGSSNAAVALLGINHALGCPLNSAQLRILGAKLGADVPFFIDGGLVFATGIGEKLSSIENKFDFKILLVSPGISVSTHWAYSKVRLDLIRKSRNINLGSFVSKTSLAAWRENIENDFEEIVFLEYPQLKALKAMLYSLGADYASLSGSGSTVFGIFSDRKTAEKAASAIRSPVQCNLVEPIYWGLRELESQN
ncbi:MAG: 4-(cytidine 5'-diphospho)-2-C-methyl-D-erythritol kinase [Calditrichaeota bacterium]|nr:MAG: 4-(cytidine 5'-diphospho)-2-C-methyl-D-erythritol kinase [Calditrichota bacterium]